MIALFAVTEAGRRAAADLAPALGAEIRTLDELPALWPDLDGAVFFLATGATVRLIAPLLADKRTDPGVVCVDEARRPAWRARWRRRRGHRRARRRSGAPRRRRRRPGRCA